MSFVNVLFDAIPVVVPVVFVLAGVLWVRRGVRQVRAAREFRETAQSATGVVSDLRSAWRRRGNANNWRVYTPVLRFATAQGQEVETVSFTAHRHTDGIDVGDRVDVLYAPADPTRACVDGPAGTGHNDGLFTMLYGGVAAVVGLGLLAPGGILVAVLLVLAAAPLAVLIRPALLWTVIGAVSPDLASMGDGGPYTVERLGAGAVLVLLLLVASLV